MSSGLIPENPVSGTQRLHCTGVVQILKPALTLTAVVVGHRKMQKGFCGGNA